MRAAMALASGPGPRALSQGLLRLGAAFSTKSVAVTGATDWKAVVLPPQTSKDLPTATGGAAFKGDLRSTSGLGFGDGITKHTDKWLQVTVRSSRPRVGAVLRILEPSVAFVLPPAVPEATHPHCEGTAPSCWPAEARQGKLAVRSQGGAKSPMQYISEVEPVKVKGLVVASHGSDDPALGCPVSPLTPMLACTCSPLQLPHSRMAGAGAPKTICPEQPCEHGARNAHACMQVEYINLKGTTYEEPAVCKYTGNRYYSDDWKHGAHHH